MRENLSSGQKLIIVDSVKQILSSYASSDSVFNHRFADLRFLGQITSPDSLVKLLTWNLVQEDGMNRYYCYFISRKDKESSPRTIQLEGEYREEPPEINRVYLPRDWYGSLYYDLRPFVSEGKVHYILLGLDYGNSLITRKLIETARIDEKGHPVFGIDCLIDGKSINKRAVFEYASTAVMSLRFVTDSMIVFDHLSPLSPDLKGNRQFYGPDFSFDAYVLEKGLWHFRSDVDMKNRKK